MLKGWASYNDVFKDTPLHIVRYYTRIQALSDPTDEKRSGWQFLELDTYNCAQEECAQQGYPAERMPQKLPAPPDALSPLPSGTGN